MSTPVGRPKWELDTPALCVELNALETNIKRMSDIIVKQNKVGWRPHTKGQKVPALAHLFVLYFGLAAVCQGGEFPKYDRNSLREHYMKGDKDTK